MNTFPINEMKNIETKIHIYLETKISNSYTEWSTIDTLSTKENNWEIRSKTRFDLEQNKLAT